MKRFEDDDDVEVVSVRFEKPKKPVQKKMTSWVSSSFDDFCPSFSKTVSSVKKDTSMKRPKLDSETPSSVLREKSQDSTLWTEVFKPRTRTDLAIHKKKVEEIYDWLSQRTKTKNKANILVLSGPPGAGKTTCLQVLSQELGLTLQHWENPAFQQSREDFTTAVKQEYSKVDVRTSQSQATLFSHFLLRANKYSPLAILSSSSAAEANENCKKSVILVEDIPNAFNRDPEQLHSILRKYSQTGQCPLVFVVTEFNSSGGSLQKLFPKDLQKQLHITHINVNPVAPTMMTKCLKRIISLCSDQTNFFAPSQSILEMIAQGCAGDLRAALNMLQFSCSKRDSSTSDMIERSFKSQSSGCKSGKKKGSFSKSKEQSSTEEAESLVSVKDTSVFLFHAVGKILYFKRGKPSEYPEHPKLPDTLSAQDRDPLLLDPEEIVTKSHVSGDAFVSFLHQNYVNFMTSVEDLERASDYFSQADCISALWSGKDALEDYSLSVATRGFIHSNSSMSRHDSVRKNQGWCPLHKSQWFPTVKQASQNTASARQLFQGCHWEPEILCTELIPFIHITNPTLHDPGQISFVHQMTQFSKRFNFRSKLEQLNEKEGVEDEEEEEESTYLNSANEKKRVELTSQDFDATSEIQDVDIADWGSDWEADDENLLGSQNTVKMVSEEDEIDFVIEDFDY